MDTRSRILIVVAFAVAIAALAGKRYMADRELAAAPIVLDDRVRSVVPDGDTLLVAAGAAGLLRLDPAVVATESVMAFPGQSVSDVAVADGVIAVTAFTPGQTKTHVHLIDTTRAELTRSVALPGGGNTLGGIHRGSIIEIDSAVRLLDATTGNHLGSVIIESGVLGGADLVGDRLYVARGYPGGLLIIDPVAMAVLDSIDTEDWFQDVTVSGQRALVAANFGGWGLIDLAERTYRRLNLSPPQGKPGAALATSGGFAVVANDAVIELDINGQPVRAHPIPPAFLAGVHLGERIDIVHLDDDAAIVACGRRLVSVPVTR